MHTLNFCKLLSNHIIAKLSLRNVHTRRVYKAITSSSKFAHYKQALRPRYISNSGSINSTNSTKYLKLSLYISTSIATMRLVYNNLFPDFPLILSIYIYPLIFYISCSCYTLLAATIIVIHPSSMA